MYRMTDEEFESAIVEALDAMPEQFLETLQNVAVVWEEEPSAYHLGYDDDEEPARPAADAAENDCEEESGEDELDDLLGLFDGLSIVERANGYDDDIPDVITVFKRPSRALLRQPRGNRRRGRQDHYPRAGPLFRPQ